MYLLIWDAEQEVVDVLPDGIMKEVYRGDVVVVRFHNDKYQFLHEVDQWVDIGSSERTPVKPSAEEIFRSYYGYQHDRKITLVTYHSSKYPDWHFRRELDGHVLPADKRVTDLEGEAREEYERFLEKQV